MTTPAPGPNLENRLRVLAESTITLSTNVDRLVETVRIAQKVQRRLAGVLIAMVLVVAGMLVTGYQVRANTRTMHEVQCNLYGLFIGSLNDPDPERVDTPKEREAFERAKALILADYAALGCR